MQINANKRKQNCFLLLTFIFSNRAFSRGYGRVKQNFSLPRVPGKSQLALALSCTLAISIHRNTVAKSSDFGNIKNDASVFPIRAAHRPGRLCANKRGRSAKWRRFGNLPGYAGRDSGPVTQSRPGDPRQCPPLPWFSRPTRPRRGANAAPARSVARFTRCPNSPNRLESGASIARRERAARFTTLRPISADSSSASG